MLKFNFLPKFSIVIFCSFILFTIVGTLSHEFGHISVAKYFGYESKLNYSSMIFRSQGYFEDDNFIKLKELTKDYKDEDYEEWPLGIKEEVNQLYSKLGQLYPINNRTHGFWITVGGLAQTLTTSFIGLFILYKRRNKWLNGFKVLDWIAIFMSLFALREVFNFVTAIYGSMLYSKSNFNGDEFKISRNLDLNEWVIPTLTLILGILISGYVIFKIIPIKYRFTFIIAGFIGGISGYMIWFGFLGELIFKM